VSAKGVGRFYDFVRAEFLKIWASRATPVFLLAIPAGTFLWAFELHHVERLARHEGGSAMAALGVLFFATWKSLLFHAAVVAFAAYWTTVDSQYGMIRVACSQPLSRLEYLAGKWTAIGLHVGAIGGVLVVSNLLWTAAYMGLGGVGHREVAAVGRLSVEALAFLLALALIAMAAASLRRTVGSGVIAALLAVIGLAFLTMLPTDHVPPRFVLMRHFFFPLQELGEPPSFRGGDSPFDRVHSVASFWLTVILTPLLCALPALWKFSRRDISE
jgi:ABC-type transport system involved in multi-copper enzyme maturation permease subunit